MTMDLVKLGLARADFLAVKLVDWLTLSWRNLTCFDSAWLLDLICVDLVYFEA